MYGRFLYTRLENTYRSLTVSEDSVSRVEIVKKCICPYTTNRTFLVTERFVRVSLVGFRMGRT